MSNIEITDVKSMLMLAVSSLRTDILRRHSPFISHWQTTAKIMVWYGVLWYGVVWYGVVWYGRVG